MEKDFGMGENPATDPEVSTPEERRRLEENNKRVEQELLRVAEMFSPHREDPLMRELCRLAVKCAQEGWIGG